MPKASNMDIPVSERRFFISKKEARNEESIFFMKRRRSFLVRILPNNIAYFRRENKHDLRRIGRRIFLLILSAAGIYPYLPGRHRIEEAKGTAESGSVANSAENTWTEADEAERITASVGTKIYRITETVVETDSGSYPLAETVQLYVRGVPSDEPIGGFLTGFTAVLYPDATGAVAVLDVQESIAMPRVLRVLLSNGAEGYLHEALTVTCDQSFWTVSDGSITTYPAETTVQVDPSEDGMTGRLCFYAVSATASFTVTSPSAGTERYYGSIEVSREAEGYAVINEVPLETYLCGVVPAEMPAGYGVEAAKTQAVCARTYACYQWKYSDVYAAYGAHVDNTVLSQCYNGAATAEISSAGVEATWGQVLLYEESLIPASYFSTSCGWTADASDVWNGAEVLYLTAKAQYTEGDYGDLSDEANFHAFITDSTVEAYDRESRWFRWSARLEVDAVRAPLEAYLSSAGCVKVVEEDYFVEKSLTSIGEIVDCYVYSRAESGLATSLLVEGSEASVKIEGAETIRRILSGAVITLASGEYIGTRSRLPSAFISLEKIKDTDGVTVSIEICGGGYGHGSGLSQTGVYGMTEQGYTYEAILAHYYPGTALTEWLE
jgi:stage II sporulation protein D